MLQQQSYSECGYLYKHLFTDSRTYGVGTKYDRKTDQGSEDYDKVKRVCVCLHVSEHQMDTNTASGCFHTWFNCDLVPYAGF